MPVVQSKDGGGRNKRKGAEVRYDHALAVPGDYEVTPDSVFVIKMPLRQSDGGWWVLCEESDAKVVETVTFRMWTYDEMIELRKLATKYDSLRRVHMVDHDVLNRLKVQRLMKAWTFGRDNPRLNIHHVNGVLTDESWEAMKRLQANLIKHIMEQMNERYEFGG